MIVDEVSWALADPKNYKRKNFLITKDMALFSNHESDLEFIEQYEKNSAKKKDSDEKESEADEENAIKASKRQ